MRDNRIKELRDAKVVTAIDTAQHVVTKLNLADRMTKGPSHVTGQALDQEIRKTLTKGVGAFQGNGCSGDAR